MNDEGYRQIRFAMSQCVVLYFSRMETAYTHPGKSLSVDSKEVQGIARRIKSLFRELRASRVRLDVHRITARSSQGSRIIIRNVTFGNKNTKREAVAWLRQNRVGSV